MLDLFSGSDGSPSGGDGEAGSMRSTTARARQGTGQDHLSPVTRFICFLLERDRSRSEAGKESRRLKLKDEVGRFYFENVRRR